MDITNKIKQLKKEKNAIILAHNYQLPEVQDIADFVGDSLGLSITAANTDADVIVFCGVHFMAETAKILSPAKTVLLPDPKAGCPMADMIDAEGLQALQAEHPRAATLCYVNTTASVKAHCDYCCTSGNALKMVQHILKSHDEIIFVPDKYLAQYVSAQVGRKFIMWEGFCPTHARILPEDIMRARGLHPQAKVLVHPECTPELTRLADVVASTEKMCHYVHDNEATEFIIGTEIGIIHRMQKENPSKYFYPASEKASCPNMKRINLEKILWSLTDMDYEITVPEETMNQARGAIERMLEIV
ncbi:MAG: quinolinate synthase [Deltaproteobacteria bacterium HGW-Deltaproteobacteria-6]|jgi:quinolinate synthase|nr:MAG: quinolinate synthase [Deltaproteobacteria bacterium HGW-Deltaproteobacteria-6]